MMSYRRLPMVINQIVIIHEMAPVYNRKPRNCQGVAIDNETDISSSSGENIFAFQKKKKVLILCEATNLFCTAPRGSGKVISRKEREIVPRTLYQMRIRLPDSEVSVQIKK